MDHGWLSVLPPLLAIILALAARQVILALLLGVWLGAAILEGGNPVTAFLRLGDTWLVDALADRDHAAIVLFSTVLGGMVGVLSRSGGTEGVVRLLSRRVRGRRGGQVLTAGLGTAVFFDDYANTLLVGNAMRPLTDRLRISREKLAYLVDSTAAPVATVAVISTWVGFEVGLIQDAMTRLDLPGTGYAFFLRSLPYSFYPLLTLFFVYLVALGGRDFGPMAAAERRAAATGAVLRPGAEPALDADALAPRSDAGPAPASLALVPLGVVGLAVVAGLMWSGAQSLRAAGLPIGSLRALLDAADSLSVLMWASLAGSMAAAAMSVGTRRLDLRATLAAWLDGARAMLIAMVILVLAWALGAVCAALGTGPWLVEATRGVLSAHLLPTFSFLLAAVISFATGTSWGTMAVLMPIVFPLGTALPEAAGLDVAGAEIVLLASVRAVLAGSVFGDHCSPLSDTTIMSSMASGSDHVDHVRTQFPYALTVGVTAVVVGYLPAGWGAPPWLSLVAGMLLLTAWMRLRGRTSPVGGGIS